MSATVIVTPEEIADRAALVRKSRCNSRGVLLSEQERGKKLIRLFSRLDGEKKVLRRTRAWHRQRKQK